jgi:hypothetical protein
MATNKLASYLEVAHFMDSDGDFAVFPRFNKLNICNLIHLQETVSKLEEELVAGARQLPAEGVEELMDKIQRALKNYSASPK